MAKLRFKPSSSPWRQESWGKLPQRPPGRARRGLSGECPPPAGTEALPLEFPLATFALEGESRPRNDLTCRSECDLSKSVYNLNIH